MKRTAITIVLAALVASATGCIVDRDLLKPTPHDSDITLGIDVLPHSAPATRAALEEWENTPVSVAYMFVDSQTAFDRNFTVRVEDIDDENNGQHVKTGMEYPADDSQVSFRGYYPVAEPDEAGVVTYDISKGDTDVMLSNTVSGSLTAPIGDKLVFKHLLTRVTFLMKCAPNQSYPEPVFGMKAAGATAIDRLMTTVSLDPGATTNPATYSVPGNVFCGDPDGFVIPYSYENPVVVEMMLEPDVALDLKVASLSSDKEINITSDASGIWTQLTTVGGEAGVRYTVELAFSGEVILAQRISACMWITGDQHLGGNNDVWW